MSESPENDNKNWSTPIDVRVASFFVFIVAAFLLFNGIVESLLHSAEFFDTGYRRLLASAVSILFFGSFWFYLRSRKLWPKLRHMLYVVGILSLSGCQESPDSC
jgi:hypothetical protein